MGKLDKIDIGKTVSDTVTEILFSGMLGASLLYGLNKSKTNLDTSINSLIEYLEQLKKYSHLPNEVKKRGREG